MPVLIAPSILSADFANLSSEIKRAEEGKADWLHVDVMDGHFVPNLTIGAPVVKSLRKITRLPLDVHLMISDPDRYLEDFAEAGTTFCTVHIEACNHLQRTLSHIRKLGMKAGVALNPATTPELLQYVLSDLDLVLVMSVNPGFGGQTFISAVLPKVTAVRKMLDQAGNSGALVSVDGGINLDTARQVTQAGAQVLVAGKSVYGTADIAAAIRQLKESGKQGQLKAG